ncbi:hypothetical protein H257_15281 [Aphanomyces astaci]|uniref:EGF-like domain-containing protein n=1 Tax=Aphanomyces astaci TaxID=112090 RepID=W4FPR0_APHAT|nr:hypothetical protein H257_15281 [Aphanomyces astaci]ETV68941.1 hypothetical protein H257_15281 [Aphanomyces astaci]|eukprot:XP_009841618.1 hypothetical protein H257_15281 [Aphanomyces astaci]
MDHRWLAVVSALCIYSVQALHPMGTTCLGTSDCPIGSSCVAGDAAESVQTCVADQVCGGNIPGNCPGFVEEGSLVCTWVQQDPSECTFGRCHPFNESVGIFKCLSVAKCDTAVALTPGGDQHVCSSACVSKGRTCNGRGSCRSSGPSSFSCVCDLGWAGSTCDTNNGVAPGDDDFSSVAPVTSIVPATTSAPRSHNIAINATNANNATNAINTINTTNATHLREKPLSTPATLGDGGQLLLTVVVLSVVAVIIVLGLIVFALYARRLKEQAPEQHQTVVVSSQQSTTRDNIQVL